MKALLIGIGMTILTLGNIFACSCHVRAEIQFWEGGSYGPTNSIFHLSFPAQWDSMVGERKYGAKRPDDLQLIIRELNSTEPIPYTNRWLPSELGPIMELVPVNALEPRRIYQIIGKSAAKEFMFGTYLTQEGPELLTPHWAGIRPNPKYIWNPKAAGADCNLPGPAVIFNSRFVVNQKNPTHLILHIWLPISGRPDFNKPPTAMMPLREEFKIGRLLLCAEELSYPETKNPVIMGFRVADYAGHLSDPREVGVDLSRLGDPSIYPGGPKWKITPEKKRHWWWPW